MILRLLVCLFCLSVPVLGQGDPSLSDLVRAGNAAAVQAALVNGADPDTWIGPVGTALHVAAQADRLAIVKAVVEADATVDSRDVDGATPLMRAAAEGHLSVVTYLVQKGADVNAADQHGATPLMWAAASGDADTVKFLVRGDAKLNATDAGGRTALDHVRFDLDSKSQEVATLLRRLGAEAGVSGNPQVAMGRLNQMVQQGASSWNDAQRRLVEKDLEVMASAMTVDIRRNRLKRALERINEMETLRGLSCPDCKALAFEVYLRRGDLEQAQTMLGSLAQDGMAPAQLGPLNYRLAAAIHHPPEGAIPRLSEAEPFYQSALQIGGVDKLHVLTGLAQLYSDLGRYADALKTYRQALAENPSPGNRARIEAAVARLMSLEPPMETDADGGVLVGGLIDFTSLRGKVTVVTFWGPRDACSLELVDTFKEVQSEHADDPLHLIHITADETDAAPVIEQRNMTWQQLFDPHLVTQKAFSVSSIPTVLILDHDGMVIYQRSPCSGRDQRSMKRDISKAVRRAERAR